MANGFYCTSLTGGAAGSLDGIASGAGGYSDGDVAITLITDILHFHKYDAAEVAAADNSPYIIVPDDNVSGTGAWVKQEMGKLIQTVYTSVTACTESAGTIPHDDTIPQIGEGAEFITRTITPTNATNLLIITCNAMFGHDTAGTDYITVALFQDAAADAKNARSKSIAQAMISDFTLIHPMVAGTVAETTFRIRAGGNAGNATINGYNATRRLGGIISSTLMIQEVRA